MLKIFATNVINITINDHTNQLSSNFNKEMIRKLEIDEMIVTEGGISTLFCATIMKNDFNISWGDAIYLCMLSERYSIRPGYYY